MHIAAPSRFGEPVLAMRGVCKVLHAGVPCCRARRVVLRDVDLVVCRGERVVIVSASALAGDVLLLVACAAVSCDAGSVWTAPLGTRVVAERAWRTARSLSWPGAPGTRLTIVPNARSVVAATRLFALVGGALAPFDRVDSVLGAP